jgi:hypothetical protein
MSASRHGCLRLCCPVWVPALWQGWSPVQGVLLTVYKIHNFRINCEWDYFRNRGACPPPHWVTARRFTQHSALVTYKLYWKVPFVLIQLIQPTKHKIYFKCEILLKGIFLCFGPLPPMDIVCILKPHCNHMLPSLYVYTSGVSTDSPSSVRLGNLVNGVMRTAREQGA